ncbi:MAG: CoB--CoM heterodisulfide reductase subunit C [Promethearchaeota archaeon]
MSDVIKRERITKMDSSLKDAIIKAGLERVAACYQCGTCTGGCPSGRRTAIRTRTIIRRALIGDETILEDDDLWLCSTCYTCYERCPRNVPVTDVIILLRNIATERGFIKPSHKNLTHFLGKTGHGVPGDQKWYDLREAYGLQARPPTTQSDPKYVEEIKTIYKSTGFGKIVGFPEEEEEAEGGGDK